MTTEQTKCTHDGWDDYFMRCSECNLDYDDLTSDQKRLMANPDNEKCDNCLRNLLDDEAEHEAEFVAKLCKECKDYDKGAL